MLLFVNPVSPLLQIWESAPKPEAHKETPLSEFFNVRCHAYMTDKISCLFDVTVVKTINHVY